MGSYVPPQWPDAVPPPGTDGWEQAAVRWLTGIIPPRYWDVPVLRQYPAALAALACHHTMARLTAIRDSYRTVRIDLGAHLPPQAIPGEVLDVHLHEGGRLRDDAEATELVSRALGGELFSPFTSLRLYATTVNDYSRSQSAYHSCGRNWIMPEAGAHPNKQASVMEIVRAQIRDGILRAGDLSTSGTTLARLADCSPQTSRRAIRALIEDGTLTRGASRTQRPRVAHPGHYPVPDGSPVPLDPEQIARILAADLTARRASAGISRNWLAALAGVRPLDIRQAEAGYPWQTRLFWARLDGVLNAGGALLSQHDAYRAALALEHPADLNCSVVQRGRTPVSTQRVGPESS